MLRLSKNTPLRFISAQPATDYYAWQVEVYINNFIRNGYTGIDVVSGFQNKIPESWARLVERYGNVVNFHFYEDTMGNVKYIPAIQAHILKKDFEENPNDGAFFFHDADFIFTRHLDFSPYLKDDNWYFSNTISYIGHDYIVSKGEEVLDAMCGVVGIDKSIVKANQLGSGGAQKLMKGLTSQYWDKVERDGIMLYDTMVKMQHVKREGDPYGIQAWTASMWAELWNGWLSGRNVVVPREFDFCWATCPIERWDDMYFFHNAGVPNTNQGMFYKAAYSDRVPYTDDLDLSDQRCSYRYYQEMKSVDSCLL